MEFVLVLEGKVQHMARNCRTPSRFLGSYLASAVLGDRETTLYMYGRATV